MTTSSLRSSLAWVFSGVVSLVALGACGIVTDPSPDDASGGLSAGEQGGQSAGAGTGGAGRGGANETAGTGGSAGMSGTSGQAGSVGVSGSSGAGGSVGVSGTSGVGGAVGVSGSSGSVGSAGGTGGAGAGPGGLAQQGELVAVTIYHQCAIVGDGRVKCWGVNTSGQLGLGDIEWRGDQLGDMGENLPFVDLGAGVKASGVLALGFSTCALLTDGRVKCWGGGVYGDQPGEMGDDLPFVDFGTGAQVVQLTAGEESVCGLLATGQVKCWGKNTYGQLGLGAVTSWGTQPGEMGDALPSVDLGAGLVVKALTSSRYHSCALFTDGRIKCWGGNFSGELGLGDSSHRGDGPGEMGDALPFVDLGTGVKATAVAASTDATCALLEGGRVKCWGNNYSGGIGLGAIQTWGDKPGQMGDALPFLDLGSGTNVVSLSGGDGTHCAVLSDGRVKCWGNNGQGQLGLGDTNARGDQPGEMGDFLPAVRLGDGLGVARVYSGYAASRCALMTNQKVKCWGDNFNSHLGLGDSYPRGTLKGHMGNSLPFIDLGALVGP